MILTSYWRAEHPFAGRNTQQKTHILTYVSSVQHPNAGQNIQQLFVIISLISPLFFNQPKLVLSS